VAWWVHEIPFDGDSVKVGLISLVQESVMNDTHFEAKKKSIEEIVESLRLLGCSESQARLHGQRLLRVKTARRPHQVPIDRRPRGPRSRLFHRLKIANVVL